MTHRSLRTGAQKRPAQAKPPHKPSTTPPPYFYVDDATRLLHQHIIGTAGTGKRALYKRLLKQARLKST